MTDEPGNIRPALCYSLWIEGIAAVYPCRDFPNRGVDETHVTANFIDVDGRDIEARDVLPSNPFGEREDDGAGATGGFADCDQPVCGQVFDFLVGVGCEHGCDEVGDGFGCVEFAFGLSAFGGERKVHVDWAKQIGERGFEHFHDEGGESLPVGGNLLFCAASYDFIVFILAGFLGDCAGGEGREFGENSIIVLFEGESGEDFFERVLSGCCLGFHECVRKKRPPCCGGLQLSSGCGEDEFNWMS